MLLRHFVRNKISKEELKKLTELKMVDSTAMKITHEEGKRIWYFIEREIKTKKKRFSFLEGVDKINDGEITSEAIELDRGMGVIYIVDRVFVTPDQVSKSIAKFPTASIQPKPIVIPPKPKEVELPPAPGGYFEVKVDDAEVKEIASFAVKAIETADNSNSGPVELVEIKAAAKQTVQGANFKLNLSLKKKSKDEGSLVCEVEIFDPLPWEAKARALTAFRCVPVPIQAPASRPARAAADSEVKEPPPLIVGGFYTVANVDDSSVVEMANFAAAAIATKENSKPIKVLKVVSAETQIVAGTNYKMVLSLVDADKNDKPRTCEVFEQLISHYIKYLFNCGCDSSRWSFGINPGQKRAKCRNSNATQWKERQKRLAKWVRLHRRRAVSFRPTLTTLMSNRLPLSLSEPSNPPRTPIPVPLNWSKSRPLQSKLWQAPILS